MINQTIWSDCYPKNLEYRDSIWMAHSYSQEFFLLESLEIDCFIETRVGRCLIVYVDDMYLIWWWCSVFLYCKSRNFSLFPSCYCFFEILCVCVFQDLWIFRLDLCALLFIIETHKYPYVCLFICGWIFVFIVCLQEVGS